MEKKPSSRDLRDLLTPATGENLDALVQKILGDVRIPAATIRPEFYEAARKRAEARGITPEKLLDEYSARLRESKYPTPDCLTPAEVQQLAEGEKTTSAQQQHLLSCEPCRSLLEASALSPERATALLRELGIEAASAHAPQSNLFQRLRDLERDIQSSRERSAPPVSRETLTDSVAEDRIGWDSDAFGDAGKKDRIIRPPATSEEKS